MIDSNKIVTIINGYKKYFPTHWKNEKYKWEAVKHFQDNWDIKADNFGEMFKKATDKTSNLLSSGYAYPRQMILEFAKADDNAVRNMFVNLFDENIDLAERIETFIKTSEGIRATYDNGTWKNHYQNTNAISTYLWLMYPNKYYIYKYELYKKCADMVDNTYRPKGNGSVDNLIGGYKMYDEIRSVLQADAEIKQMLDAVLTDSCYPDPELITLTIDLGFYATRFYEVDIMQPENETRRYWIYAPGENAYRWEEFYNTNIMGIGWDYLGNLSAYNNSDEIKQKMIEHGESNPIHIPRECWQFANDIAKGDIVFAKNGTKMIIGCGIVISDYRFDDSRESYKNIRKVKWIRKGKWNSPSSRLTLTDKTNDKNYIQQLKALLNISEDDLIVEADDTYSKEKFLSDVFITEAEYDKLHSLVLRKKNIILQGAPGVGKTFSAKRLAYSIIGEKNENRIFMVQFHQNYSYEDFIMGYRPNDSGGFELQSGVFYNFCERCKENPDKPYFFIIDEINRGNLSKIFGELLMLIETDKRGEANKLNLVYGGTTFYIPENLHIIGMMNTADRSLAMIDYALRRRFSFYTMSPAFDNATTNGFGEYTADIACELYHTIVTKIKELNNAIRKDSALGNGFEIGHSYFVPEKKEDIDDNWVRNVVEYEIIPLIEEYWFDDDRKTDEWKKALYQALGEEYDGR